MAAQGPGKKETAQNAEATQDTAVAQAMAKAKEEQAQKEAEAARIAEAARQQQLSQAQGQQGNPQMTTETPEVKGQFATPTLMLDAYRPRFNITDQGDADANVLIETVREIEKKTAASNGNVKSPVNFHTIAKSKTGCYSAVAVSVQQVVNNALVTGVQTLIIESSRPPLENLTQQTPSGAIEIVVSPVEAFTNEFIALVHQEVARFYNNQSKIVDAGLQVIYRETQIRDENTIAAIMNEATQAIDATLRQLDPREKQQRFSLLHIVNNPNAQIVSKFALDQAITQPNGLPVRSDITSELQLQTRSAKQQTIQATTTAALTKSACYVDLIYTAPAQQFGGMSQQQAFGQAPAPYYIPRIITTALATEMSGSPLEFILLGVANNTSLNRNRGYGVQWRDSYSKAGQGSLRNLGAIGWQMPHLNTAGGGQPGNLVIDSDLTLQQLINTAIHSSPVYSLEIEQAGPNGWLLEAFAQAATGNLAANRNIVDAADALTGGRFRPIYARLAQVPLEAAASVQLIRATQDLNYVGYYKNAQGEYADLRELDLVAILNIANGNVDLVRDYLSTVVATAGEHALQRLDKRLRIFRTLCSDVVVKGYTTKYDFNATFIKALIEAIEATKFVLNANNSLLTSNQQVYTQTIQDWASVMVDPTIGNGLYQNQGFQPQGMAYNIGQNMGFSGFYR